MGEFIELIGQLKPKNNGTFPIADVNDLKGGYIQLQYTTELNAYLDTGKVKQGMLAYVAETNKIYQFQQGIWIPWSGGSGCGDGGSGGGASIIKVDNLSDLNNPALKVVGQIVYVTEIKDLRYFDGTEWKSFTRIYIQPIPPEDKGGVWIDTSDEKVFDSSNGTILNLIQIISILEEKLRRVEWALGNQLDFGDFTNNHYQEYDDHPSPEEPVYGSDTEEDFWKMSDNLLSIIEEVEPTQHKSLTPNGRHLSIKGGTYAQMIANANNFLPNELLWCDDRKQLWIKDKRTNKLVQIGSVGGDTPGPDDETMEQILTQIIGSGPNAETKIVGIEFGDMNNLSNTYRLSVKDGKLDLYDYRLDRSNLAGNAQTIVSGDYYSKPYFPILSDFTGNTNSPMIYINSIYCGGDSTSKDYNPCSHNFIEIVNLANIDLNLKGLYLHYTEKTTGQWVSLPLKGIIKAKGTFLIRGAACSVMDINTTYIKVKTFDIEWKKENTYNADVLKTTNPEQNIWGDDDLIKFSNSCSFYISGEESPDYFKTNLLTDSAPWSAVGVKKWYVDLVGIGSYEGTAMPNEGAQIPATGKNFLYYRYHTMDFISQAIIDNDLTNWYIETNQNYMIPTDLFRYCHKEANLSNVLEHLSWKENIIEVDPVTGRGQIVQTDNIQGLRGRIPVRLFTSLVDNTDLLSVFRNTYFDPFYGLRGTSTNSLIRGLMYPIDLLKKNVELTNISDMFSDTNIPIGVDINSDLFINNTKLRNISRVWSNCSFDKRAWDYETEPMNPSYYPQIDFINIFKSNIRITNASNLFAVTDIIAGNKGLQMITADLLRNALNINDVSGMFYYNILLTGAVPLFSSNIYTALNGVSGYLTGVNKGNITNADELETRLKPLGWD